MIGFWMLLLLIQFSNKIESFHQKPICTFPFDEPSGKNKEKADLLINVDHEDLSWWVLVSEEMVTHDVAVKSGIDNESYVIITEEYVVDGVATFMARCIFANPKTMKSDLIMKCEELMAQGKTGKRQGFDLPGRRLGRSSHRTLLSHGPKNLGSDSSIKAVLSPVQEAAMAEERRLQDDSWSASRSREREGSSESPEVCVMPRNNVIQCLGVDFRYTLGSKDDILWQCNTCTLLNKSVALICEACGMPTSKGSGEVWSCKFCTLDNSTALERCMVCGEWRYSYGNVGILHWR